jgi:hypothetical protein
MENIIIIVCGGVEKNLLKQLIDKTKKYDGDFTLDCRILVK